MISILFLLFNCCFSYSSCSQLSENIRKNLDEIHYIFCIDGGGSKTELQIVDKLGNIMQLHQHGQKQDLIKAGSSNFTIVGEHGIKQVVKNLCDDVTMTSLNCSLSSIIKQSLVVGGFAGGGRPEAKIALRSAFKEYGFDDKNIIITTDADMALELADNPGIIIIAGTGSICLGKKDETVFHVGGLGRYIGDEGSGYKIGMGALKVALEEEYGWGNHTSLTQELRMHFNQPDLKNLVTPFYQGTITPDEIAALTPLVFNQAAQGDVLAQNIIDNAAHNAGWLLKTIVKKGNFQPCPLHLVGGVFKNSSMDFFIQKMLAFAELAGWPIVNNAHDHIATVAVQKLLGSLKK